MEFSFAEKYYEYVHDNRTSLVNISGNGSYGIESFFIPNQI